MPHNLYLHSSIVKYRRHGGEKSLGEIFDFSDDKQEKEDFCVQRDLLDSILHFSYVDSGLALSFALIINASILIVAGAALSGNGEVAELREAYDILSKHLGQGFGILFAVALLFSGQSSTITGTLAGLICFPKEKANMSCLGF
jgi:manganese transport protein